jgi:hypothetical protein
MDKLKERLVKNLSPTIEKTIVREVVDEMSSVLSRHLSREDLDLIIKGDYPRLDDINFLQKITKLVNAQLVADDILADHSDSYESQRARIEKTELFYFQRFVTKYINRNSPYRGVQLFYGLGAGKTRTSIAICNSFIEEGRKVLVLTPASLEENFRKEYEGYVPPCLRGPMTSKLGLLENFEFLHYNAPNFAKSKEDEPDQLFDKVRLDNKIIVIDEVHNFVSLIVNAMRAKRPRGIRIYNKIMKAKNIKIIALSGTPIINFPFEAAILINLLVGYLNSRNNPWTESDGTDKHPIFSEDEDTFNRVYLDSDSKSREYKIKETTEKAFCRRLMGNVSYYGGLTGGGIYPESTEHNIKIEMSEHQFGIYLEQRLVELNEISEKKRKQFYSDTARSRELNMDAIEKKSSFRSATRELCNFAFPSEIPRPWRKEISAYYSSLSKKKREKEKEYVARLDIQNILADEEEKELDDDIVETDLTDKESLERQLTSSTISYAKKKVIIDKLYHRELEEKLALLDESKDVFLDSKIGGNTLLDYCYLESITPAPTDFEKNPYEMFKFRMDINKVKEQTLAQYSPKMLAILYNIEKARVENGEFLAKANSMDMDLLKVHRSDGNVVIYSYFNRVEGVNIMQKILDVAGYEPYNLGMGKRPANLKKSKGRYCFWEGKDRDKILEIFNAPYNKYGLVIKILLITEAGAEGITLKNVRQMHIMEPYWNEVQTRQVIGRAKRMYSHKALGKPVLIRDTNTEEPNEKHNIYLVKQQKRKAKKNDDGSLVLAKDGSLEYERNPDESYVFEKNRDGSPIYEKTEDGKYIYLVDMDRLDKKYSVDLEESDLISEDPNLNSIQCVVDPYRPGEQHVNVFRYKMKFTESQSGIVLRQVQGELDELLTTDEVLNLIAQRKKAVTDQIELFMKQTAADCLRNKLDNDKHEIYNKKPPIVCYDIKGLSETTGPAFSVAQENVSSTSRTDIQKTVRVVTSVFDLRIVNNKVLDKGHYVFKRDVKKSEKSSLELPCIYIYPEEVKSLGFSSVKALGYLVRVGVVEERGKTYEVYKGRRVSSSKEVAAEKETVKYVLKPEGSGFTLQSME